MFKLAAPTTSDETKKLKLLTNKRKFLKEIDTRIMHILSQGVSSNISYERKSEESIVEEENNTINEFKKEALETAS